MPRFAANLTMMFNEVPFLDRFEAAAKAGFTAVEFLFPYDYPAKDIGERLRENGLTQALFNLPPGDWAAGEKGFAALPDRFEDLQHSVRQALPYVQATGVRRVHLMAGIAERADPRAMAAFRKSVKWAAEFVAPHGLDVVIEPINPRNVPGYFLNDFGSARDVIGDLKIPNLKLQFDIYHCQIIHGDVTMRLREMMPIIGHIQIASIPSRNEPDGEELNYPFLFDELDRLGYGGFVGCEYVPRGKTTDGLGWFKPYAGKAVTLRLGCIADDYTGASDLANTLTRAGLRTVQTIGVPAGELALPEVDAVVVSLKSRSIEATDAVSRSRAAEKWLRGRGAAHVLFKICSTFDSTDKGNIGPVMDALRADCGDKIVLVTPAFPATGRTVYQGNLFVGAVPLNESPLKDHPLNPMHDSNLVRVLARQSQTSIGLVELAVVARGADAVRSRLADLAAKGVGAAIIDAVFDRDLETIGAVALDHRLSVGASGIGLGLARALVGLRRGEPTASSAILEAPVGGPAACLAGSCSQATLGQVASAEAVMPVLHLDADRIIGSGGESRRALAWARERIGSGPVLIASSAVPGEVAALQARHGREASGHAIEQAMADIAEGLVQAGVRRLVVAGGETSGAVVDRLGIPGFLVGAEIAPGVPVLRAVGARAGDMLLALKSGNFGGPEFFSDALDLMR